MLSITRFHGISPSSAKEKGARLRSFAPLKIILTLEGGTMTEYRIVEKAAFTVIGKKRRLSMEGSYSEIPKFWQEHMSDRGIVIGDPRQEVPEGYETRQIPAPKALRDVTQGYGTNGSPTAPSTGWAAITTLKCTPLPRKTLPRPTAKYGYLLLRHKNTPCFSFEAGGIYFRDNSFCALHCQTNYFLTAPTIAFLIRSTGIMEIAITSTTIHSVRLSP